jgi:enoyl-CoA hydratase/carnithine racemase
MIRTTVAGRVTVLTLDRPARRNALRPRDLEALEDAVAGVETPVGYLHGAGSAFSAGADLDAVADLADPAGFARLGQRVATAIETAPAVVVAGVDGPARGGGVELALACDLRVATPDATFAEPGVGFGLFGAWGGTVRLPRAVGPADAADIALSGRVVDADGALRMGLVSRVVEEPRAVADEVAANEPDALRVLKHRLRDDRDRETRERAEATAFERLHEAHASDVACRRRSSDDDSSA